jgi:hypothetical protein
MKGGAFCSLHTVRGPWTASFPEGDVMDRVPILCRDDEWEMGHQAICHADRFVSFSHGQRTAGTEVILDID